MSKTTPRRPSEVFAWRLREVREAKDLSQGELARRLTEAGRPISRNALLQIERGKRGISLDEAIALIAQLDVVPAHLLTPEEGERVGLTDDRTVDGMEIRAWLRYGFSFIAAAGDLPAELVEDRTQHALAVHALALVDATRGDDIAGQREALRAIGETVLAEEARKKGDSE